MQKKSFCSRCLLCYVTKDNLISKNLIGFQENYRTADYAYLHLNLLLKSTSSKIDIKKNLQGGYVSLKMYCRKIL